MLCGGPPCQGFSGMNRFNSRQYSLFKVVCLLRLKQVNSLGIKTSLTNTNLTFFPLFLFFL